MIEHIAMTLVSKDFENNLIKTLIGVIILIVGASLVAAAGNLMYLASSNLLYTVPGVLVFIVGVVLVYYGLKILISVLKHAGLDLN